MPLIFSAIEISQPVQIEPVTMQQARSHLRVTENYEDTLISTLIPAARKYAENILHRAIGTQTWQVWYPGFPGVDGSFELPMYPLSSVDSIDYTDENDAPQTLDPSMYTVFPQRLLPLVWLADSDNPWPETQVAMNSVSVTMTGGLQDVSEEIVSAMLLTIGHLYENREATTPINVRNLPQGVANLLGPKVVPRF